MSDVVSKVLAVPKKKKKSAEVMFYNTFAFQIYKFHKVFNTEDTVSWIGAAINVFVNTYNNKKTSKLQKRHGVNNNLTYQ